MPTHGAVCQWVSAGGEFANQYARARAVGYEYMADEIIAISDDSTNDTVETDNGKEVANSEWIARSKLRVDSRKWLLSKMLPKVYGDKLELDGKVDGDRTLTIVRRVLDSREDLKGADA